MALGIWDREASMEVLVATLISWIAANSNLEPPDPPQISLVPKSQIGEVFSESGAKSPFLHLEAYYHPDQATVYLPTSWSHKELRDRSILLHELVHHAQWQNEAVVSCHRIDGAAGISLANHVATRTGSGRAL
jgi:hypothetical protein